MLQTILTAAVAALVAFVFSVSNDLLRERRAFRRRWDRDVYSSTIELLMAARQVGHLASTVRRGGSDSADVLARLDDMHREVRTRCSALLILADSPLAEAALTVQRQVYAVVEVARGGEDPRPGDGTPDERLTRALDALSHRARNQLDLAPIAGTRLD